MTLELLRQSLNVPVLFAVVTRTGHVLIEEFADAESSLDWDLEAPAVTGPVDDSPYESSPLNNEIVSPEATANDVSSFEWETEPVEETIQ